MESNTLVEKTKLELTVNVNSVWALAYSPDGAWLATGDSDKKVNIFDSVKNSKVNYCSLLFMSKDGMAGIATVSKCA